MFPTSSTTSGRTPPASNNRVMKRIQSLFENLLSFMKRGLNRYKKLTAITCQYYPDDARKNIITYHSNAKGFRNKSTTRNSNDEIKYPNSLMRTSGGGRYCLIATPQKEYTKRLDPINSQKMILVALLTFILRRFHQIMSGRTKRMQAYLVLRRRGDLL